MFPLIKVGLYVFFVGGGFVVVQATRLGVEYLSFGFAGMLVVDFEANELEKS